MDAPLRIALGYNNVYAVDGPSGRVLIDTGPDYKGAAAHLVEQLGARAPAVVVATHGHLDHAGLGRFWVERGVPVAVAEADVHLAAARHAPSDADFANLRRYVEGCGAPDDARQALLHGLDERHRWARAARTPGEYPPAGRDGRWPSGLHYERFEPTRLARPGRLPEAPDLEIVVCPGHTPGNLVVVDREDGWLFSGDQLLPDITPTPAIQAAPPGSEAGDWRFHSLPPFLASLEALRDQHFSHCFPGHGEPFGAVTEVIAANIAQIEQRTARVLATLTESGRGSVYALCEALYPRALRRRFWQIAATVQGHIDLLEQRRQVVLIDGEYEPLR
jgi:glyoxylase-like metal-dependent hydrolase (beta-lactamase superfamily II)